VNFKPLSNEDLAIQSLLPEGIYEYQVVKSEDKISKAGNEYTAITLMVWDEQGKERLIFTNMAFIKLLKHFCDVNGMEEKYKSGSIPAEDFIGKNGGKVCLGVEGEKPNPSGGVYPAKNVVKDYIVKPPGSLLFPKNPVEKKEEFNDDIPF
jgi:hypothetical protein